MLATGIRTDVGIKIYGASLDTINALAKNKKSNRRYRRGKDLFAEPNWGKYIDIIAKRDVIEGMDLLLMT
jgi:Cu(I)/Ag(I) efflux system membrane protein CusA/SilA